MNYRNTTVCDVCGKEIKLPTARMEWGYGENEIHVCHHKCSMACTNPAAMVKDLELDSNVIPPEYVYDLIFAIAAEGEIPVEKAEELTERLFDGKPEVTE